LRWISGFTAVAVMAASSLPGQSAPASSDRSGPTVGFATDLTVEMGGDDFLEVLFTDGGTQKIRAGQGGTVDIGGILKSQAPRHRSHCEPRPASST
jgi:hypothetical protein